jgi:hypothetical protein
MKLIRKIKRLFRKEKEVQRTYCVTLSGSEHIKFFMSQTEYDSFSQHLKDSAVEWLEANKKFSN